VRGTHGPHVGRGARGGPVPGEALGTLGTTVGQVYSEEDSGKAVMIQPLPDAR
jgi:hypothetical protein